jgi:hypothetical protein
MKFIKSIFRILLVTLFFSFYIISIAINFNHINNYLNPLEKLHLKQVYRIDKLTYLSTFPTKNDLIQYKHKYHIQRVITVLNYKMLISKELLREEEKNCKELGLELVYIPVSYFSTNPMDYTLIKVLLKEDPKVTLIHAYWFDHRMQMLKELLQGKTS